MKNTLSKSEIKLENMKMWLTEQIRRYGALAKRNLPYPDIENVYFSKKMAYIEVLARLTEDEKC
jgi:hypothetical protein